MHFSSLSDYPENYDTIERRGIVATYLHPPRIRHCYRKTSDSMDELSLLCASALHMSKGELALLQFYSECQNGFRPAVKLIAEKTGMNRSQIFRCRTRLEEHGVVKVEDDVVLIDWNRVRLFSTLDPRMTHKKASIAPVSVVKAQQQADPEPDFFHFAPLSDVCSWFGSLNSEDFSRWKRNLRRNPDKLRLHQAF